MINPPRPPTPPTPPKSRVVWEGPEWGAIPVADCCNSRLLCFVVTITLMGRQKKMLSLISIVLIPDALKSKAWKMWEYRILWRDARRSYEFGYAWEIIRCMTSTYMFIEEIKCSHSVASSAQSQR